MEPLLGPADLAKYTDAQLYSLLGKMQILIDAVGADHSQCLGNRTAASIRLELQRRGNLRKMRATVREEREPNPPLKP